MVFVPSPPPASARAEELGRRLAETINAYRREQPELTRMEIRHALRLAFRDAGTRPTIIALGVGAAILVGALAAFTQKSGAGESKVPAAVFVVLLGILVLFVFFRRLR